MKINKQILNEIIEANYSKWLSDIKRLITADTETANDILNDILLSIYNRIDKESEIEVSNLDGYIYRSARFCKTSTSSKYQRLRAMDKNFVPIDNELYNLTEDIEDDISENDCCYADVVEALNNSGFDWYTKELYLRKNLEGKTTSKMASDLKISRGRVAYRCKKINNYLKNILKNKGQKGLW